MNHPRPFISVIICTYNGADLLGETLSSLERQTYPRDRFEVIVVDDGSTDETANIARRHRVRLIGHETNRGIGAGRNTGLAAARGELIAYTDDDCIADENWLFHLAAAFRSPEVMGAGGKTLPLSLATPTQRYMDHSGYGNPAPLSVTGGSSPLDRFVTYLRQMLRPLHTTLQSGDAVHDVYTLNAAYRTELLRAIGGFDEQLRASEDTDVSARLHATYPDKQLIFVPEAQILHRHRTQFWPWVKQTFVRSGDAYLQTRKTGKTPPLFPFPVLCLLGVLVAAVLAPLAAPIVALAAPLALYWWWSLRLPPGAPLLDRIRFPHMQALLEGASLAGIIAGAIKHRGDKK